MAVACHPDNTMHDDMILHGHMATWPLGPHGQMVTWPHGPHSHMVTWLLSDYMIACLQAAAGTGGGLASEQDERLCGPSHPHAYRGVVRFVQR